MPTKIEWTDETWNPVIGCSRTSPGCDHCYAVGVVHRQMSPQHVGLTVKREGAATDWTGEVRPAGEAKLMEPLRWRKPRKVFVNSLSDLFHPDLPDDEIAKVFAVMALAPQHTFQILTKRPQRMAALLNSSEFWGDYDSGVYDEMNRREPERDEAHSLARFQLLEQAWVHGLPNVWLGTSIESDRYTFRADHLRATPAAVRWISAEPLLGPLPSLDLTGIDWLVVGGESGPGARPMHPAWARDLRDRCAPRFCRTCDGYGVTVPTGSSVTVTCPACAGRTSTDPRTASGPAFLFKQWGDWAPNGQLGLGNINPRRERLVGEPVDEHGCQVVLERMGKKAAGRELDGRTWDEYPEAATTT